MKNFASFGFLTLFSVVVPALGMFVPSAALAETRTLKLYYVHTGERAEITFKKDGRYLSDGLKKLNVFLRDWRRNEPTKMDPRLFDLVWQVHRATGSKGYITVVSAYRSPATNTMLRSKTAGVAKNSQHTLGRAMDYFIPGVALKTLRDTGMRYQIGGVGYYPKSGSPFVHMDVGSVRHWPRMSRSELLAVFPDGKTVHVPTDGKPLPGYQEALASVERRKATGGDIVVASRSSSSSSGRSKTLFGALFGGGADEEEDISDDSSRQTATARPARQVAPVRNIPAEVPVAPTAPVQAAPEQLIAALPTRNVPTPEGAPRPNSAAPQAVETPVNQTPEQLPFAVAQSNVPLPVSKPARSQGNDAVALAMAQSEMMPMPSQPAQAEDAATAAETPAVLAMVPIPSSKPSLAVNGTTDENSIQTAYAVVPGVRPSMGGADAIAALVDADGNSTAGQTAAGQETGQQLALVAPKPTRGNSSAELIAPPVEDDTYTAANVAVRRAPVPTLRGRDTQSKTANVMRASFGNDRQIKTTAKGGRFANRDTMSRKAPKAVVQPAVAPASEVAMSSESVAQAVPVTNPVLRNDAMREAPHMVYTVGFQRDLPSAESANSFKGKAVTFLSVAKFP